MGWKKKRQKEESGGVVHPWGAKQSQAACSRVFQDLHFNMRFYVSPVQSCCTQSPLLYIRFPLACTGMKQTNRKREKKGRRPSTMLSVTQARRLQLAHASVLFTLNAKKDSATLDEKRSKSSLCTVEQLYNKASVTIHKRANSSHEDLNSQPARGLKNNSNNGSICKEENS